MQYTNTPGVNDRGDFIDCSVTDNIEEKITNIIATLTHIFDDIITSIVYLFLFFYR